MTDEELKRTPIASEPISVLLLVHNANADVEAAVAAWMPLLRDLKRDFEVIVVEKALPQRASEGPPSAQSAAPPATPTSTRSASEGPSPAQSEGAAPAPTQSDSDSAPANPLLALRAREVQDASPTDPLLALRARETSGASPTDPLLAPRARETLDGSPTDPLLALRARETLGASPTDPLLALRAREALTQRFPEVRVVAADSDGLGSLLGRGLGEAKKPLVFFTLTDGQYQPADVRKLLEAIDRVDVVTGVRTVQPIPLWLRAVDFCVGWFCLILFGLPRAQRTTWLGWRGLGRRLLAYMCFGVAVHDPECVFCLVRRDILKRIIIQSHGDFGVVEFLAKANFLNALFDEVPISFTGPLDHQMAAGTSFMGDALTVFRAPDFGPCKL